MFRRRGLSFWFGICDDGAGGGQQSCQFGAFTWSSFEFEEFELAGRAELVTKWPVYAELIGAFTAS